MTAYTKKIKTVVILIIGGLLRSQGEGFLFVLNGKKG